MVQALIKKQNKKGIKFKIPKLTTVVTFLDFRADQIALRIVFRRKFDFKIILVNFGWPNKNLLKKSQFDPDDDTLSVIY